MFLRTKRLFIALLIALIFAGVTLLIAQAEESPKVTRNQATAENCGVCHTDTTMLWQEGLHGEAASDPVFIDDWTKQGKPGACMVCHATGFDPASGNWEQDGVACVTCHNPIPANHPNDPVPVDKSAGLCVTCHSGNRFGWEEWQVSAHYQRNMTCIVCHDAHAASIKPLPDISEQESKTEAASQLCINCHKEYSMDFPYSVHNNQGLTCTDCHLRPLVTSAPSAHAVPDHSFVANVSACSECHKQQMHGPTASANETAGEETVPAQILAGERQPTPVTPEPKPVGPVGFASLAGLVGLGVGMVLAPWLERFYHRVNIHKEENDGQEEN